MEEIFGDFNNLIKNFNNGDSLFFAIDEHRQFGSTTSEKQFLLRLYTNIIYELLLKHKKIVFFSYHYGIRDFILTNYLNGDKTLIDNLTIVECGRDERRTYFSFDGFCKDIERAKDDDVIIIEQLSMIDFEESVLIDELFNPKFKIDCVSKLCKIAKDNNSSFISAGVIWSTPFEERKIQNENTFNKYHEEFKDVVDYLIKINSDLDDVIFSVEFFDDSYRKATYLINSYHHRELNIFKADGDIERLYKNARLFGLNKMDATNFALDWANSLFV